MTINSNYRKWMSKVEILSQKVQNISLNHVRDDTKLRTLICNTFIVTLYMTIHLL